MAQDINSLFDIGSQPDPMQLVSMANQGQQALESGLISKKEAKANQKKIGLDSPDKTQDFLTKYLGGQSPQNPYVFAGGASQGTATPPPKPEKGLQTKNTTTTELGSTDKHSHDTHATQSEADNLFSMVRNQPEIAAQQKGIQNLDEQYQQMLAQKAPGDSWVKPLLALSDSINGGNQAGSFQSGSEKRNADLQKFANEIQQRKGDFSKTMLDSFSKLKTGSDQNTQNQKNGTNVFVGTGMNQGGLNSSRLLAMPLRAGQDFDKQLAPATKAVESFNNGEDLLNNKSIPLTENNLNMIQQDISNGLSASGNATDSKLAMDMIHTLQGKIAALKLTYKGTLKPEDDLRAKIPDIVDQVHQVLQNVRSSYSDRVNRQMEQIAKTYEPSYDDIPNLRETVTGKMSEVGKRFPRSKNYSATGISEASAPVAVSGKDVKVSNAKGESFIIHPGAEQEQHLAAAAAEGYKAVQ